MINEKLFDLVTLMVWTYFPMGHREWLRSNYKLDQNTAGYIKPIDELKVWELEYLNPDSEKIEKSFKERNATFTTRVVLGKVNI